MTKDYALKLQTKMERLFSIGIGKELGEEYKCTISMCLNGDLKFSWGENTPIAYIYYINFDYKKANENDYSFIHYFSYLGEWTAFAKIANVLRRVILDNKTSFEELIWSYEHRFELKEFEDFSIDAIDGNINNNNSGNNYDNSNNSIDNKYLDSLKVENKELKEIVQKFQTRFVNDIDEVGLVIEDIIKNLFNAENIKSTWEREKGRLNFKWSRYGTDDLDEDISFGLKEKTFYLSKATPSIFTKYNLLYEAYLYEVNNNSSFANALQRIQFYLEGIDNIN